MSNDLVLIRGDTLELSLTSIKYDTGEDYILTDTDRIVMDIKRTYDGQPLIHKEITSADYVEDALQIIIYPEETAKLPVADYVYDVRLVQDEEHVYTIIPYSKFCVHKNVSEV